ncbi:hypothetical protein GCM10010429_24490 [Micromonospora olivasterospora]|uniref:Putative transposase of IS4/5 family DUF4096 n=1 Tax=Micromonospora olivasterospora TaxID=1880 RepID=A0A562IIW5_MICOL|nr:putative transposase of IS4/5 family DUF4096 [Micromonospora olivasterospora]
MAADAHPAGHVGRLTTTDADTRRPANSCRAATEGHTSEILDSSRQQLTATVQDLHHSRAAARTGAGVGGRAATRDLREILNAILYVNRTGIVWRYLPHDFPPWQTGYGYLTVWTADNVTPGIDVEVVCRRRLSRLLKARVPARRRTRENTGEWVTFESAPAAEGIVFRRGRRREGNHLLPATLNI